MSKNTLSGVDEKMSEQERTNRILKEVGPLVDDLVLWAFRYFLGRMTIQTWAFAGGLVKVWPDLSVGIRACIKCDLEEAFDRDDRSRADGNDIGPLGQAVDRHSWALVRKQYKN